MAHQSIDEITASAQLRMIVLPCSRCKNCYKIEFPDETTVLIDCVHTQLEGPLTEVVKQARICTHYSECINCLRNMLKTETYT